MQDDTCELRVVLVVVALPIAGNQINFDIARARVVLAELEDGAAEIGTRAVIPEAWMEHAHRLPIGGAEFVAAKALVMPDVLEEALRRMRGIALAQEGASLLLRAPLFVKVRLESGHGYHFNPAGGKVKAAIWRI
jgi:hypothetical protein